MQEGVDTDVKSLGEGARVGLSFNGASMHPLKYKQKQKKEKGGHTE